jgi:hypothetical protein
MKLSPLSLYVSAAVFQTAGSSGAAMLAPFLHERTWLLGRLGGYSAGRQRVGRVCSDLLSGVMATYFSPGPLLIIAMIAWTDNQYRRLCIHRRHAGFHGRVDCLRPDRSDVRFVASEKSASTSPSPDGKAASRAKWPRR